MTNLVSELRHEAMSKKFAMIKVTAEPQKDPPWVSYSMDANYPNQGGKQEGENLKFDNRAGEFEMQFSLVDNTKLNLAFYPSFEDAIWVVVGEGEPSGPGNGGGAILPGSVVKQKLIVTNANKVSETLTFTLRFTGDSSGKGFPPYLYDPKIINGGDGFIEQ